MTHFPSPLHNNKRNDNKEQPANDHCLSSFRPISASPSLSTSGQVLPFPDGIKVWHDCPDAKIDICFVHGITGNRDTTWTAPGRAIAWPPDFLPAKLPEARLLTFGYDAYIVQKTVASSNRLVDHAANLLNDLTNERSSPDASRRRIIFVAHSLGGLVCKEAILQSRNNPEVHLRRVFDSVIGIAFMGTPHKGSWMADWSKIPASALGLVKSVNKSLLEILETDDQLLESIQSRFWSMVRELRENSYAAISIHANHSNMVKFGSEEETGFKRLLGDLTRWDKHARPVLNDQQNATYHYAVPLETVVTYTERDVLSQELEEKIRIPHKNASVPFAVAIYGLGGSGKSQLALKYAESHQSRYNPILWMDSTDEEAARSSFKRCAVELDLSQDQTEEEGPMLLNTWAVQSVLRWLRDRTRAESEWLVIVDNADDFSWGIKQDDQSPKLVTAGCEGIAIGTMSPLEATALLLQHLPWSIDSAPSNIRENCEELVRILGYLPLAIDLAGAYISNDPYPRQAVVQYLSDFTMHRNELLQMNSLRGLLPTEKTVWTVWDKTLQKITDEYPYLQTRIFLSFLARFKGTIIKEELFRLAALGSRYLSDELIAGIPARLQELLTVHDGIWDSFLYRQNRDVLVRYSLLQRVDGDWPGVTMHGLVQLRTLRSDQSRQCSWSYVAFMTAACRQAMEDERRPEFRRHQTIHIPDIPEDFDKATVGGGRAIIYTSD
ncbi:hypothetical protein TruAng_003463 [Truncatella angustata]|nr:hypothetical protein TruAng_003463 [Truncatella angustata]